MINEWWWNCSSVNICEIWNNVTRAWDLEKIWVPTGFEPMTFRTPGGRSIHWATRTHGEPSHLTGFLHDMRLLLPAGFSSEYVVNSDKWALLHYFIFHIYLPSCNFTITHLSLFTTYSLLNPAGSRRRMSCKNPVKWLGSPWVLVAQWIERPPRVRKVMGSNPVGTQIFSRSHARVTLFHISHIFTELQFHHHSFITIYHIFTAESCRKQETHVM